MNTRMMLLHRHTLIARLGGSPQGYESMEYVGSGGNAYIDTGVMPNPLKTRMQIDISIEEDYVTKALFGARREIGDKSYCCNIFNYNNTGLRLDWAGVNNFAYERGRRYIMDCISDTVTIDGVEYKGNIQKKDTLLSGTILLFNINTSTTADHRIAIAKIYGCKIWDIDGVIIRDFKPCKRISDNRYGLFDMVNKKFYISANSNDLIGG